MAAITREEVAHLAVLARLALTEEELDHYAEQLDVILTSVARVSEVAPSLTSAQALSGAPASEDERFRVPRILDEA